MNPDKNKYGGGAILETGEISQTGERPSYNGPVGGAMTSSGIISQNGLDPITATSLAPATAFKLAPKVPETASIGLGTAVMGLRDTYATNRDAEIKALNEAKSQQGNEIVSLLSDIAGSESNRDDLYASQGVDQLKKETDELSAKIAANDLAARRQIETIVSQNPTGMVGAGAQGEIQRIERENARQNADLAIVLAAKNKQYDTAKGIIDRKINAETEADKIGLDALKFFYTENKDSLNKKEKEVLDERIKRDEREYQTVRDLRENIAKIQFELAKKEAPMSIYENVGKAESIEDALIATEGYLAKGEATQGILDGLPVSIQSRIYSQANNFGSSDVVKRYNAVVDSINTVNGIPASTKNPADHQAIVYAFAKSLDPESVVREGEYETIKKYAQNALSRYGKEISNAINGTGFLSEAAITNIKNTMNNNFKSKQPSYENLYKETARVINNVAGKQVADAILIDFSKSTPEISGTTYNGVTLPSTGVNSVYQGVKLPN